MRRARPNQRAELALLRAAPDSYFGRPPRAPIFGPSHGASNFPGPLILTDLKSFIGNFNVQVKKYQSFRSLKNATGTVTYRTVF